MGHHIPVDDLPAEIEPRSILLRYYVLVSFLAGPFFFLPLIVRYVRFRTLRYRIDDEGVSMRWGALSQREIVLNYARIQDIHLTSNVLERWLGLAKIRIQTASGSAKAEMVMEGLERPEDMRDFLYSRMRGGGHRDTGRAGSSETDSEREARDHALVAALNDVTAEIRALRAELSSGRPAGEAAGERGAGLGESSRNDR